MFSVLAIAISIMDETTVTGESDWLLQDGNSRKN